MDQEIDKIVQATAIASDWSQSNLHAQALEYLNGIQANASVTWRLALALFVDSVQPGVRKHPTQARFFALRVLDDYFSSHLEPFDHETFTVIQQAVIGYIRSEYVDGPAESTATFLRNKFSHTLTLFFLCTYVEQWPTFFVDLFALILPSETTASSSAHKGPLYNRHVSLFFFHLVLEISGEVHDQIIKNAREFTESRHKRDGLLRDAVRQRDSGRINEAVLTIVADYARRLDHARKGEGDGQNVEDVIEVVDLGIRTFGSYVGWIDINLTVTQTTVPLLFTLLADQSLPIRLASSAAILRIVSKGLQDPSDKLQLIKVLSIGPVVDALEKKTREEQRNRENTDEGEESYRESLGKLLNGLGIELMKLVEGTSIPDHVRSEAGVLLEQTLPTMLRFMADEYDDTCSTTFPMLRDILTSYKKLRKTSPEAIDAAKRSFLQSLLQVILEKLRWDEDTDPDEEDEDDRAAFETLRKDLRSFMDSILSIDSELVISAVRTLALTRLSAYQSNPTMKWNDAELAIYLVWMYGEINKTSGKGRGTFCQMPTTTAMSQEEKKSLNYAAFPLTHLGEMMTILVQSGISGYPHSFVVMQYFETVTRYGDFFKVRKECIMPVLQAMMDTRGLHSSEVAVRSRTFYLFYKFISNCKNDVPPELVVELINGLRDLLPIVVDLPELDNPEQDLLSEAIANPGLFDGQLYVYETVGILLSILYRAPEQQHALLRSVVQPLMEDLNTNLETIRQSSGEPVSVIRAHHNVMALGNIVKGFPDYPSPVPPGYIMPPLQIFDEISRAIIISLEAMNVFRALRDAARSAFARILAATGPNITHLIPTLMQNLLTHFEPPELVDFMNFLGLLVHKLQNDMASVLDELLSPLMTHISQFMAKSAEGTDDELVRTDILKAYLGLLNSIIASKLTDVFISQRNQPALEPLLQTMQSLASNVSDPVSQKAAFIFLSRSVSIWIQKAVQGSQVIVEEKVPGFKQFVYESLVPTSLSVLAHPDFNIKDGLTITVLAEISGFFQTVCKACGQEGTEFLTKYLLSQGWPGDVTLDFTTKMNEMNSKDFRAYLREFVRNIRSS